MADVRYVALGPLLAGEGSRAFLGLAAFPDGTASPVVLVWVPEEATKDASLLERVKREQEHAAKLEHPNIVKVYGFAHLDEGYARVVEFADGESLRTVLTAAKRLPLRIAAKLVCDAAMAAHFAHLAGNDDGTPLVHGDIRPETMLLSFNGAIKISGYGALNVAPREMGGHRVKGRRVHSAPEQIIGGRSAVTVPTDVYLLGLMFLECLTGTVPFVDDFDFDQAVLMSPLPPPPPDDVPPAITQVIERACAKKALERYPTALALKEAIEQAVGEPLASNEEIAGYLRSFFPPTDASRAARRQAIDAGIADFARRQWAERPSRPQGAAITAPYPGVTAPPASVPPPVVSLPIPINTPGPVPKWTEPERPSTPSVSATPNTTWVPFVLVGILAALGYGLFYVASQPQKGKGLPPRLVIDAGPAQAAIDSGAAVVDSGAAPAVPVTPPTPAVVDAGPVAAAVDPSAPVEVAIDVTPDVTLVLDGVTLGTTPWKGTLPPGRKVFQLVNKDKGITSARVVTVKAGTPVDEKFTIGRGKVAISAPDGAVINIDGKKVGVAPMGEIPVYEGGHRILVTVGAAKWSQAFNINEDERQSFTVEFE